MHKALVCKFQNENMKVLMLSGITVTAFSPLGNGKSYSKLGFQNVSCLEDQTIKDIANKLNISAAQVMNENISEIIFIVVFQGPFEVGIAKRYCCGNKVIK